MSEPAFPVPNSPWMGLTKREYIAAQILVGLTISIGDSLLPSVDDAVTLADRLIKKLKEEAI